MKEKIIMRKIISILLIVTVAVVSSIPICTDCTYAASKVKKGTSYWCVKSGNTVYCSNACHIFKVDLTTENVTVIATGRTGYPCNLKLQGNYLYYSEQPQSVEGGDIRRINIKTCKNEKLASGTTAIYVISDSHIYYQIFKITKKDNVKRLNRVMCLSGKAKKSTKYSIKLTRKKTNTSGYYIWDDTNWDDPYKQNEYNHYLETPETEILLETLDFPII